MTDKKHKINIKASYIAAGLWLICGVALIAWYSICYPSHFLLQEQNQVFLNHWSFVSEYFRQPSWLSVLAGDWLTQFYYYPVCGPVILTLAITLCAALFMAVVLRLLPKMWGWVLTVIFALILVSCSFSSTTTLAFFLSVAGGIGMGMSALPLIKRGGVLGFVSILIVVVSYWAFGFGAFISAFVIFLFSVLLKERKAIALLPGILAILLALLLPLALCRSYALPYTKAMLYPGIAKLSMPEMKYEHRLHIADTFYDKDYERTKQLAQKVENPDEFTSFYYYLASAMQDSLPDNLFKYPVKSLGTLTTIGETTPLPIINMMNDLYFEVGDMTYAERAAMMRNVFSPRNRNVRMIRRLAEINLVSGDTLAAEKYLGILNRTHRYAEWSRNHTPGQMTTLVENEISNRRSFINTKDNIRLGDNCRHILLELLESNPGNTKALDYLLCTDLLLKDMDTFKMDYDTYCMKKGTPRYKDLYQQALMIYLAGTDAPQEEWERYIVSDGQLQMFNQYSNRRGDPAFSGTYWYYFDRGSNF